MDGITLPFTFQFSTIRQPGTAKGLQEGATGKGKQRQVPLERQLGWWLGTVNDKVSLVQSLTSIYQTSKRTTRRPQTIGHSALPAPHGAPTSSPFTHTPLAHAVRNGLPYNSPSPVPGATQGRPPHYPTYPYQYTSSGAYPGYVLSEPAPVSKGKTPVEQESAVTTSNASMLEPTGAANEDVEEGSDAWEAAQTILKAINFGSLLQASVAKPLVPAVSPLSPSECSAPSGSAVGVPDSRLAPPDNSMADGNAAAGPVQVLSNRERASLQAQLALLAAQLAEIAEDTLASDLNVPGAKRCAKECGNLAGDEEKYQD